MENIKLYIGLLSLSRVEGLYSKNLFLSSDSAIFHLLENLPRGRCDKDETLDAEFVKIKRNNLTLYIRKSFLGSDLGQALLSGEETLRKKYLFKTLAPSEFSRVCKFNILLEAPTGIFT